MKNFLILILIFFFCGNAHAISEKEYALCQKNAYFSNSDTLLNTAWKDLKNASPQNLFKIILDDQRTWVKTGRDIEARALQRLLPEIDQCALYGLSAKGRALYFMALKDYLNNYPGAPENYLIEQYYSQEPILFLKVAYDEYKAGHSETLAENKTPDSKPANDEMRSKIDDLANALRTIRQ